MSKIKNGRNIVLGVLILMFEAVRRLLSPFCIIN